MTELLLTRPSVRLFASSMEAKLRKHDDKPGWQRDNLFELLERLEEELQELRYTLGQWDLDNTYAKEVLGECADVGNFSMMIHDLISQQIE